MDPDHREGEDIPDETGRGARRARRMSELSTKLRAALTSRRIEGRGVFVENYLLDDEIELGPFGLDDVAVILLHRGVFQTVLPFAGVNQRLGLGGVIILPPATAVRLALRGANFTIVYLAPEQIPNMAPSLLERRELVPTVDPDDEQLSTLMSSIRLEMQSDFAAGRAYFESQALSLTIRLFALYSAEVPAGGVFRGGLAPRRIRQAKNRILVDLDKSVSVTALAREAGLSRSHFCRAFKRSTGVSPHQWRLKKRFERALALLADDNVTLTSIADVLGFASLSHFSAAFKQATGLAPSQYRRQFAS